MRSSSQGRSLARKTEYGKVGCVYTRLTFFSSYNRATLPAILPYKGGMKDERIT